MRVLIIDSSIGRGGAREQALRLAAGLVSQKVEVVLALAEIDSKEILRLPEGVKVVRLAEVGRSIIRRWIIRCQFRRTLFFLLLGAAKLHELFILEPYAVLRSLLVIRRSRCDVVQLNNLLNTQLAAAFAAKISFRPCISVHQDFEYPSKVVKAVAKGAITHVAISRAIAKDLMNLGVPEQGIKLIHNCIDPQRFHRDIQGADLERLFDIPRDAKVILFCARLVEWKGAELFIEALNVVSHNVSSVVGLIVGEGSEDYVEKLRNLVDRLGVTSKIYFSSYQSDVAPIFRAATVFVHCSTRAEPFGLVVAEAMACGTAVVSVKEGGPLDIIESGVDGILVRPRDVKELASAILELIGDKRLRERIGFAAATSAQKFFLNDCAEQYIKVYRNQ